MPKSRSRTVESVLAEGLSRHGITSVPESFDALLLRDAYGDGPEGSWPAGMNPDENELEFGRKD